MIRTALLILAFMTVQGCGSNAEERYDVGYSDGYAVGYNTACDIRATLIEGDWKSEHYARGYADGGTAGTIACNEDRRRSRR